MDSDEAEAWAEEEDKRTREDEKKRKRDASPPPKSKKSKSSGGGGSSSKKVMRRLFSIFFGRPLRPREMERGQEAGWNGDKSVSERYRHTVCINVNDGGSSNVNEEM